MARRPAKTVQEPIETPDITEAAAKIMRAADAADLALSENTHALAQQLRYTGSLHPAALEDGIAESKAMINQGLFTLGARLLLLKEQAPHGEFIACLERHDIDIRLAQRTMKSTLKFSNTATSPLLEKLSKSKIFELAVLDDEEIADLTDGGSARGITLDEVDRMSVTELRKRLREAKAESEAKERLLADKNTRLDELHKELHQRKAKKIGEVPPNFELEELHQETAEYHQYLVAKLDAQMRACYTRIEDHHAVHGGSSREIMGAQLDQIQRILTELRETFALPVHVTADGVPEWERWNQEQEAVATGAVVEG